MLVVDSETEIECVSLFFIFIFFSSPAHILIFLFWSPSQHNSDEVEGFLLYAKEGNVDEMKAVIKKGMNLDIQDEQGQSALHWAVDGEHVEIVKLLVEARVKVNLQDCDGQTPLHYALNIESNDIIQLLLKAGADVTTADAEGVTPQALAADLEIEL